MSLKSKGDLYSDPVPPKFNTCISWRRNENVLHFYGHGSLRTDGSFIWNGM